MTESITMSVPLYGQPELAALRLTFTVNGYANTQTQTFIIKSYEIGIGVGLAESKWSFSINYPIVPRETPY